MVDSTLFGNFIFAAFVLPYIYTALRILSHTLWKRKKPTFHNLQLIGFLSILVVIIIIIVSSILFSNSIINKNKNNPPEIELTTNKIQITSERIESLDFATVTTTIKSEYQVLKYDIAILSTATIPIYSSNYPFTYFSKSNEVSFNLPENPPNDITITYIADRENENAFEINAYMLHDSQIYLEEIIYYVPRLGNN